MSIQDQYLPKKEDYEQLQETFDTFLKDFQFITLHL